MNVTQWTIGAKLWALSSFLMLDMLLLGLIDMRTSGALLNQVHDIADTQLPAIQHMTAIDMRREGLRSVVLGGLRAAGEGALNRCLEAKEEVGQFTLAINQSLDALASLKLQPETRHALEEVRPALRSYVDLANEMLGGASRQTGDASKSSLSPDDFRVFQEKFQALESQIQLLCDRTAGDARLAKENAENLATHASFQNTALLGCGIGVGLIASLLVVGKLVRGLRNILSALSTEAAQVSEGASRIHTASSWLTESTIEQASAIDETVASMEEMAATIGKTADSAGNSHSVATRGEEESLKGKQVIARMLTAMESIEDSNSKLQRIVDLIHEIEDKTQIINDIVFETRLLSFNASIEAARAGVHGKGFSVVAEEVGKLAVLSGKAADEIRKLLESSTAEVAKVARDTQERVLAGKHAFTDCEESFRTMDGTLKRIRLSAEQIATATHEQEIGVKQTNKAMASIDQVMLKSSGQAESLSVLAGDLESGASSLQELLAVLRGMVSGNRRDPAANAPLNPGQRRPQKIGSPETSMPAQPFSASASSSNPRQSPELEAPRRDSRSPGSESQSGSRWQRAETVASK